MLSYDVVPDLLLQRLEYAYPPLLNVENIQDIRWIVVLGGGHTSDLRLPATSQLSEASLARLVEGIRLYREIPKSKLVLSGGRPFERTAEAKIMAEVASAIGVKNQDMILEELSKDTEENAWLVRQVVGRDKFVLVTSASHMPRSMALFKKLGMDPIPAPTDYLVKETQEMNPSKFYPGAENLYKAQRAFYEYLGLAWAKLRGKI
jgi:uncharacterized SAM-binding protein YcdF (DUF218 family)